VITDSDRLKAIFRAVDDANAADPVREPDPRHGARRPRALIYGERMTETQQWFAPEAGELLRIAARAQHIRRWEIPRGDYPDGRDGYQRWRRRLGQFHGEVTAGLMRRHGYGDDDAARVAAMLEKRALKHDPEVQTLEDIAGLVFLEHYLAPFVRSQGARHGPGKLMHILQRTAAKMSPAGRRAACGLALPEAVRDPVLEALQSVR
jgi:hypothetical protein